MMVDDTTRHKTVGQLEACFAAPACSSCSHDVLCPPFSVPFHPFRTETNDHFIGVRASCAPIHWHIIISLSSSPSGMRYLTLAIHLRTKIIILLIMLWATDHQLVHDSSPFSRVFREIIKLSRGQRCNAARRLPPHGFARRGSCCLNACDLHFPLRYFHVSELLVNLRISFASQVQCSLRGT